MRFLALYLLVFYCLPAAFAQPKDYSLENLNLLLNASEEGKTYYLNRSSAGKTNSFFQEVGFEAIVCPAVYKEVYDTIVIAPALNGNLDTSNYFIQTEIIVTREPAMEWKEVKISKLCMPDKLKSPDFSLCLLKTTPKYEIIHTRFYPFKNILDTTRTDNVIPAEIKIVKRYELIKATRIEHYPLGKAPQLKAGERQFTVEAGYWSKWEEAVCPMGAFNDPEVGAIQDALIREGYKLQKTGKYDEATKRALVEFQRDHVLPEGELDDATLARLGIKKEMLIQVVD